MTMLQEGWQQDPAVESQERWFDGNRWTNLTRPKGAPAPEPLTEIPVRNVETYGAAPVTESAASQPQIQWKPVGDVFGSPAAPRGGGTRLLAVLVAFLLVAAAAGVFIAKRDSGPSYPKEWDARVADIAHYVEAERGARFEHPVQIVFMDVQAFKKEVNISDEVSDEDRKDLENITAALRAVGLLSGKVDLEAMLNKTQEEGIIGFYDPDVKKVWVRGVSMTPALKVTLAHELTHALQDQLYDITKLQDDPASSTAMRALIEADAERIEDAYVETLSDADREAYEKESDAQSDEADLKGVPDVLLHSFTFPYTFGPPFLKMIIANGGNGAVDEAFSRPPNSEADLLDPLRWINNTALDVPPAPPVPKGYKVIDDEEGEFGQSTLLEMLSPRVGFPAAWKAVQGWRGDRGSIFKDPAGKVCVGVNVRFDSAGSAEAFNQAAASWAAVIQGSSTLSGNDVLLRSCDPGGDAPALPEPTDGSDAFNVLAIRSMLMGSFMEQGAKADQAACAGNALLDILGPKAMGHAMELDEAAGPEFEAFTRAVANAAEQCGAGG